MPDRGRVIVVGGGLAGMTVAKEVAKRGVPVSLFEADVRLGGKAGADQYLLERPYEDHGYHIFPGWYVNTRALLAELEPRPRLIDIDRFHYLRKGEFPRMFTFEPGSAPRKIWRNLTTGLVPWNESAIALYAGLDLASHPFSYRSFLDRVSVVGFLRSRFYATEGLANLEHRLMLQASSIPAYEMSAMTAQKIARAWMKTQTPFLSILDGDLESRFIAPFDRLLQRLGVTISVGRNLSQLAIKDGTVFALEMGELREGGRRTENVGTDVGRRPLLAPSFRVDPEDRIVLATPHDVTLRLVDDGVWLTERGNVKAAVDDKLLSELCHLRSLPMASMHVYLKRKLDGMPAEHINFYDSPFQTSVIDVSHHWPGVESSILSFIAADFAALSPLRPEQMKDVLLREIYEFLPIKGDVADVNEVSIRPNLSAALFLNTVGAWHYRPNARTRIRNLYVAGDYCRTDADLTTMESAVQSGLQTAAAVLEDMGIADRPAPIEISIPPRSLLVAAKWGLLPFVIAIHAYSWMLQRLRRAPNRA